MPGAVCLAAGKGALAMAIKIPLVHLGTPAASRLAAGIKKARQNRNADVQRTVATIVDDVRSGGDRAICAWTLKTDKCRLTPQMLRVDPAEIVSQARLVSAPLRKTMQAAARRIKAFHRLQKRTGFTLQTAEGRLQQIVLPLARVGVYIPGGYTVYPSTVLMDVIPAQIAGVKEIVAVTPPRQGLDPAIACALDMLGITELYRIGGSQAIAALAYGTATIKPVDKIVGPGNAYVAAAKRMVYGTVDIDAVAGPSEVAIIADETADPTLIALDLLSQAEHGSGDEVAVCVTESTALAQAILTSLQHEIETSPVQAVFARLAANAITIFVAGSRNESIAFVNDLGPEHLQIMTASRRADVKKIRNAAAIFLGQWTPVALGDYCIGTNHVLPTGGAARFASPLGVESFMKRMSVAEVSRAGLARVAGHVARFARAENLVHHALSVERRVGRSRG
jgi:histidinol dehydrogenase